MNVVDLEMLRDALKTMHVNVLLAPRARKILYACLFGSGIAVVSSIYSAKKTKEMHRIMEDLWNRDYFKKEIWEEA